MKWFFKNIATCKRPYRLFKKRIENDGIKKGVGMIGSQQHRSFHFQHGPVAEVDSTAENPDGQPGKKLQETVEQAANFTEDRNVFELPGESSRVTLTLTTC